jgi:hypothetical protein
MKMGPAAFLEAVKDGAMNLFLAMMWLAAAAILFLWPWLVPHSEPPTILDTGLSLGWAALFMCLFNLARWQTLRAAQRQKQALQEEARQRWEEKQRSRFQQPRDPNFDFSEGPPPREPGAPPEGPDKAPRR